MLNYEATRMNKALQCQVFKSSSTQIAVFWKEDRLSDGFFWPTCWPKAVHVVVIVINLSYWKPDATHHSMYLLYDMFIIFLSDGFMVHSHSGTRVTIYICFRGVWVGSKTDSSASLTCGCKLIRILRTVKN